MAVVALEKLEAQLNCSVCLDTYTSPKQLQCQHVYCQQCLEKLVVGDQQGQGQLMLTCPSCRQVTPVPASGVAGLQSAFQINKFLDIVEEQKKGKASNVHGTVLSVSSNLDSQGKGVITCSKHGGREVELYCNTCEEPICFKCIMKNEQHQSHDYEEIDNAFKRYQGEIMSSLAPLEKQVATIENVLAHFDQCCAAISDQEVAVEADIHKSFAKLHEILDARKTELISQLHGLAQSKIKILAAQKDHLETTQAQLNSCLLLMRENLKTDYQGEALLRRSTIARQVKELTSTFQADTLVPDTEADMLFLTLANVVSECQSYGKLVTLCSPEPSKCCCNITHQSVGQFTADFQVVNYLGQLCKAPMNSFSCKLASQSAGAAVTVVSVEKKTKGQYKINGQPAVVGKHKLDILVNGQHIKGSPFIIDIQESNQGGKSLREMMSTMELADKGKVDEFSNPVNVQVGLTSLQLPPPCKRVARKSWRKGPCSPSSSCRSGASLSHQGPLQLEASNSQDLPKSQALLNHSPEKLVFTLNPLSLNFGVQSLQRADNPSDAANKPSISQQGASGLNLSGLHQLTHRRIIKKATRRRK